MKKNINIAIIPARGGSKRIKLKNIKSFNLKPIIAWSIRTAIKSNIFDRIIVSTDSNKISKVAKKYGAEVPFLREKRFSNDSVGIDEVIKSTINKLDNKKKINNVCCIMATAPFLKIKNLRLANKMIEKKNINYVFSAIKISSKNLRSFTFNRKNKLTMVKKENYKVNSQNLEKVYLDAGQFYFGKFNSWLKRKKIYSKNSQIIEISKNEYTDIDTPKDWKEAINLIKLNEK